MHSTAYPLPVDPSLREGVGALYVWLLVDRSYSQLARESICRHVAREGTPEGAEFLEAEDMAEAERVFVDAFEPVGFGPSDWGPESDNWHWEASELEPEDAAYLTAFDQAMAAFEDLAIPPVCGGGFEPDEEDRAWAAEAFGEPVPFVPSAEDWAEMHAYRDAIEPTYGYE